MSDLFASDAHDTLEKLCKNVVPEIVDCYRDSFIYRFYEETVPKGVRAAKTSFLMIFAEFIAVLR